MTLSSGEGFAPVRIKTLLTPALGRQCSAGILDREVTVCEAAKAYVESPSAFPLGPWRRLIYKRSTDSVAEQAANPSKL